MFNPQKTRKTQKNTEKKFNNEKQEKKGGKKEEKKRKVSNKNSFHFHRVLC